MMEENKFEDCPKEVIEVRRNADGSLDEIVARNCMYHLEQMSDNQWWMAIYKDGYSQVVNIGGEKVSVWSEMDHTPENDPRNIITPGHALYLVDVTKHDLPAWGACTEKQRLAYEGQAAYILQHAEEIKEKMLNPPTENET